MDLTDCEHADADRHTAGEKSLLTPDLPEVGLAVAARTRGNDAGRRPDPVPALPAGLVLKDFLWVGQSWHTSQQGFPVKINRGGDARHRE